MIRFNTFRPTRYLRSKFVEGKYLLASEATDLELEILDLLRKTVQQTLGDIAVEDAWKVEKLSATQLLIRPGEAWFKGLPFVFRTGNDALVSGAILSLGTVPVGVTVDDDSTGLGKVLTFNDGASTPTNLYKISVLAQEELITESTPRGGDPFLQNVNLTETTAQKIRLNFKINIVPDSLQSETAVPYRDENSLSLSVTNFPATGGFSSPNLVNQITVTPVSSGNGELISLNALSGSEAIDGRDLELVLRNDPDLPSIGSGRPIPIAISEVPAFQNGKLIDSNGNIYHLNLITQDVVSNRVILRIDKELDQPNPEIIVSKPFTLVKRDVYVTDSNGQPRGKLYWDIATLDWNSADGILHESKIVDLRNSVSSLKDFEAFVNNRQNLKLTSNGAVFWSLTDQLIVFNDLIHLINPHGTDLQIQPNIQPLLDGGALAYELDLESGGVIGKGNLSINITSAGAVSNLDPVSLSSVQIGNTIRDNGGYTAEITDIDDVNNTITTSPALVTTGAATIYLDSFGPGMVPLTKEYYILAVRKGAKAYFAGMELEDQESMQIGDGPSYELLTFIGSTGDADDAPNYTSVTRITQGSSLVNAISELDSAIDSLYWKDPVDIYNNLPLIGNQVGDVRLATSNRIAYTWTGSTWTDIGRWKNTFSDYATLVSIATVNINGDVRLVTDTGIPYRWDSTSSTWKAFSVLTNGAKLLGGGTWTWNAPNLTFTADAYVEIKSQGNTNNTIPVATQSPIVLSDVADTAYVIPNPSTGGSNLTVSVANASLVPTNAVIIARRFGADVLIGTDANRLREGYSTVLDATGSVSDSEFVIHDSTDGTKKIVFDAGGTTSTKTTLQAAQTADRTLSLPDITDTLVARSAVETLSGKQIQFSSSDDSLATGPSATMQAFTSGVVRLTNGSLESLGGIPAGSSGQFLILENKTGVQITVKNQDSSVSASDRIYTGTDGDILLKNNATLCLVYDSTSSRWHTASGAGGGGGLDEGQITVVNNQVSAADVTGLVVDGSQNKVFKVEYGITRRHESTGSENSTFYSNLGTGFTGPFAPYVVEGAEVQSDGKVLVLGQFTSFNGNTRNGLVRLNSNGTEDTSFYSNLGTGFGGTFSIKDCIIQPDGKIVIAGEFTSLNGNTRNRLVRLNSDGTEDTSFYTNLGTGFNDYISSVDLQSDGKIVVGGIFTSLNGNTRNRLVRLNSDGTEDTSFYTNLSGGVGNGLVMKVLVQSDGKILVGGHFTSFGGNTRNYIVRLNSNGTEDTAFYTNVNSGGGFDYWIRDIGLQSDGKIVVGGYFTSFNLNYSKPYIIRLNSSGTEDTSFYINLGGSFDGYVEAISVQPGDKILVGGQFTTLGALSRAKICKLNADGSDDSAFYTMLIGSGFTGTVFNINISSSGVILITGIFSAFNGNTRNYIVNLIDEINIELLEQGQFAGTYKPSTTTWSLVGETSSGDDGGLTFSIDSAGQVKYTSSNLPGTLLESILRFKLFKL